MPAKTEGFQLNRVIGDAVESSTSDLEQLARIDLKEMRCHKRHTG
jgi:hypothetical protein